MIRRKDAITIPTHLVTQIQQFIKSKRVNDFVKESILLWYVKKEFREKVEECVKISYTEYTKDLSLVTLGTIFHEYLHEIANVSGCNIPTLIQYFLKVYA